MKRISSLLIILLSFITFLFPSKLIAQSGNEVSVTLTITPPYSPYFDDYINFEGAILILQNNTNQVQTIQLRGSIEGDNGLYAMTMDDYHSSSPVRLGPFEVLTFYSNSPVYDFMDPANIETNISQQMQDEVWRLGVMPEGNYTICVQAFDYETGLELSPPSPFGCTMIPISLPQPPEIITPVCETSIEEPLPVFSWTPVVGNLVGADIRYDLYIVKLQPALHGMIDPYYAMQMAVDYNAGNPLIIRDQQLTNYLYSPGDPPLVPGATYAFQVIAHDANNLMVFENDGKSDVCSFTYQSSSVPNDREITDGSLFDNIDLPVMFLHMTSVSGKLFYKFNPGFTGLGTLHQLQVVEETTQNNFFTPAENSINPQMFLDNFRQLTPLWTSPYPEGVQYFDHDLQIVSSSDEPLAWTQVRLVTRYIYNNSMVNKNANKVLPSGNVMNVIPLPNDNGKVLSTVMTDGEGNYNFKFVQPVTGHIGNGIFRVITMEVVNPYFYSPDIKILSLPGDDLQLPNQVALVRTYNLNVNVRSDQTPDQYVASGSGIAGVEVTVSANHHFCQNSMSRKTLSKMEIGTNQFPLIQQESDIHITKETAVGGWASFSGLVRHHAPNTSDRLAIYASTPIVNEKGYLGKPIFRLYPSGEVFDPQKAFTEFDFDFPLFNSDREVDTYEVYLEMEPDNPRIFGRVKFGPIGLEGVAISLWTGNLGIGGDYSDEDGYFGLNNVLPGYDLNLWFSKAGFPTNKHHIGVMQMGQYIYHNHDMTYPGEVFGYVQDERGDPVLAEIKFGEGEYMPYIATEIVQRVEIKTIGTTTGTQKVKVTVDKARFQCPAYEGTNIPLEIIPRSDKYFPHTFSLDISNLDKNKPQDIGTFTMYEKLHRIMFKVVTEIPNSMTGYVPVANAKVEIVEQDLSKMTNNLGEAYFKFASPGSYFWVKVTPPEGTDYVPYYEKLHLPVTKQDSIYSIVLERGYSISGFVTAGPDSIPVNNARVFINSDIMNGQNFVPLVETFSEADGSFELRGIPEDPTLHEVHAVKFSPDTSFVGDFELVSKNTPSPIYMNLKIYDDFNLSEIWKMPVEIEDLYTEQGAMFLSGAFVDVKDNPNFQEGDPNSRLSFDNIQVVKSANFDDQGRTYLEPKDDNLPLYMTSFPIGIQNNFTGAMVSHTALEQNNNPGKYQIKVLKDETNEGYIPGIAEMDLSSFKFSYNYNAQINLADQNMDYKLRIFTADPDILPQQEYFVGKATSSGLEDLSYSVHDFNATADQNRSTVMQDTVKLYTILHTAIPDCTPSDLEVEAGYVKIIPTDILQIYGGESLSFKLEEWDVIGQETWTYDKNHGGIVIPKARINTGIIDLDVDDLLIKPNVLKIDQPNLDGKVTLAGITTIDILPGNKIYFHYDNKCSSDTSGHWRFSVMPQTQGGSHVAEIPTLPGMAPNTKIHIGQFSLFSNDETQMDQFDQTITFYQVFDLKLDGNALSTHPNSFELHGTYNLNIPNLGSNFPAIMQFSKPGTNIELNLLPPYLEFAASGDVKFKADQYQEAFNFSPGLFEAIGTITILDQGAEINLKAKLTRSINEIKVDIIKVDNKNQRIAFGGSPDKYLEVMEGQMIVTGNSWEKLWFDGATIGLGDGIKNPYQNLLHFVADGSVNVAPEDGTVDVSGVDTPFGSISITIDFLNMSLHGSLTINTPIATGYCTFVNGSGVLHIDGSGFYFGLGLTVHALSIPVDIQSAVIIGYYPTFDQPLQDLLNDYSYRNEMPMVFNGGVEGFLLSLTIQAVDFEEELDLGFAGFYVNVNAGLNLIIYATFTDPPAVGVELTAFAHLGLELWFLCTNVGVFFNAELIVGGQYVDGDFDLFGCGSLQIGIYYDVCELVADCFMESLRLDIRWGTSTGGELDLEASLGGGSCSGNQGFSNDHSPCNN